MFYLLESCQFGKSSPNYTATRRLDAVNFQKKRSAVNPTVTVNNAIGRRQYLFYAENTRAKKTSAAAITCEIDLVNCLVLHQVNCGRCWTHNFTTKGTKTDNNAEQLLLFECLELSQLPASQFLHHHESPQDTFIYQHIFFSVIYCGYSGQVTTILGFGSCGIQLS